MLDLCSTSASSVCLPQNGAWCWATRPDSSVAVIVTAAAAAAALLGFAVAVAVARLGDHLGLLGVRHGDGDHLGGGGGRGRRGAARRVGEARLHVQQGHGHAEHEDDADDVGADGGGDEEALGVDGEDEHEGQQLEQQRDADADLEHAHRLPRAMDAVGEAAEVVGHQHDARRLRGHGGALHAHGDAHVGGGERGAVVDAVAHHGHRRLLGEVLDRGELLLRLHARVAVGDAHARADGLRRLGAVAGEHDRLDVERVEGAHRLGAVGAHAVGEAAHRGDLAIDDDPQHACAARLPLDRLRRVERQLGLGRRCAARARRAAVVRGGRGLRYYFAHDHRRRLLVAVAVLLLLVLGVAVRMRLGVAVAVLLLGVLAVVMPAALSAAAAAAAAGVIVAVAVAVAVRVGAVLLLLLLEHARHEPVGADVHGEAVDDADDALALEQLELLGHGQLDLEGLREVEEGGGDRVRGEGLDRGGEAHDARRVGLALGHAHLHQPEVALRDGARLVEGHGAQLGEELHLARALDEDAPPREGGDAARVCHARMG
eukprot:scaffold40740_cov69-Phaeocystis_antarctica.AAC.1